MARGLTSAVSTLNNRSEDFVTREEFNQFKNKFISARVTSVIYDENSPGFSNIGEWNSIGTIQYEVVDYFTKKGQSSGFAKPYFSNIKQYPLVNEIVFLFRLPGNRLNQSTDSEDYYYINPVSLWNHQHHNAMPNVLDGSSDDEQRDDYQNIEGGQARRVQDGSTEVDLNGESGGTFVEKANIHPLLPFAGDIIVEGRFGNSIRLGNTAKTDSQYKNEYSEVGDNGDPITIIRNGQPTDSSELGWLPVTENINKDLSSLTLTSTQKIPVKLNNENYEAFKEAPIIATEYVENQAILNSGRLVFQAKSDSVIIDALDKISLTSESTIGLASNNSINLASQNIKLGSKDATESLVLGDSFMQQFENLCKSVKNLASSLENKQIYPGGAAVPDPVVMPAASNAKVVVESILNVVKKGALISKVSKTT